MRKATPSPKLSSSSSAVFSLRLRESIAVIKSPGLCWALASLLYAFPFPNLLTKFPVLIEEPISLCEKAAFVPESCETNYVQYMLIRKNVQPDNQAHGGRY